jgi:hypothetical protein
LTYTGVSVPTFWGRSVGLVVHDELSSIFLGTISVSNFSSGQGVSSTTDAAWARAMRLMWDSVEAFANDNNIKSSFLESLVELRSASIVVFVTGKNSRKLIAEKFLCSR